jgi:predicted transcriptional regulator YdeE
MFSLISKLDFVNCKKEIYHTAFMKHKITTLPEFKVIGIAARTGNDTTQNDIPKLWQKFYSENIADKIPNKISDEVISLYTDYESDYTKPYTILLGCKVKDFGSIPKGMVSKIIPGSKYEVFTAKGEMPHKIIETWQKIWNSKIDRTYTGDFEVYTNKYNSSKPEADIYIAVKS